MRNKSVDIYFFTGTGNTYLAARKIKEVFEQNGCTVRLLNIEQNSPSEIDLSKTIAVAFPVACWNTYPFVRRFIKALPKASGTEAFVFSTMGDSSLKAAANFGDILKKKGYSLIATKGFKMPNNLISIQSEEKNIEKRNKAYIKIASFALDILNSAAKPEKTNIFFKMCLAVSSFITLLWEKKPAQKLINMKVIKEKCVKCGLCAKICPVKNISYKDFPYFDGNKCQICMRCVSYCPTGAIDSLFVNKGKVYKGLNESEMKGCFKI